MFKLMLPNSNIAQAATHHTQAPHASAAGQHLFARIGHILKARMNKNQGAEPAPAETSAQQPTA